MQIISGTFKGRKLATPKGEATRPTQSRVRAAIFNSLQHSIAGASFLDICAGSGAMGLEALSRGAAFSIFIEQDRKAIQAIEQNIALLHVEDKTRFLPCDALLALQRLADEGKEADIIYFDPPYTQALTREVISVIDRLPQLLSQQGYFITEERKDLALGELVLQHLRLIKTKSFGDTNLFLFTR